MKDRLARLMRKMQHQFEDEELLELALTHRSRGAKNYERMEFLGDSILGFVVADWLFESYPDLAEGKLSRMRSSLVRRETLAKVARQLEISDYLILGEGEMKSGGFNRDSILADSVESLIGALYLDSGFEAAKTFILEQFEPHFSAISDVSSFKDAKSRLQERMQKCGLTLPDYRIAEVGGEPHKQEFTVVCELPDLKLSQRATGSSRRIAEQQAAAVLLKKLDDDAIGGANSGG